MVGARIEVEGGFRTREAKAAFLAGRFEWLAPAPEAVKQSARACAESGIEIAGAPLRIERIQHTEREFLTDRGRAQLSAWRLTAPEALGSIWLVDPELNDWRPARSGPPRPDLQPPGHFAGMKIEVGEDDRSIVVDWLGSPPELERYDHAVAIESEHAVALVARGIDIGPSGARTAVGFVHRVPGRLQRPLGARVFVDLQGRARVALRPSAESRHPDISTC